MLNDLIARAERRAYALREDGQGYDAKLIEELLAYAKREAEREAQSRAFEEAGLLTRTPAPCAAPPMGTTGKSATMRIDATGNCEIVAHNTPQEPK
jgi:hypothetical protein